MEKRIRRCKNYKYRECGRREQDFSFLQGIRKEQETTHITISLFLSLFYSILGLSLGLSRC